MERAGVVGDLVEGWREGRERKKSMRGEEREIGEGRERETERAMERSDVVWGEREREIGEGGGEQSVRERERLRGQKSLKHK